MKIYAAAFAAAICVGVPATANSAVIYSASGIVPFGDAEIGIPPFSIGGNTLSALFPDFDAERRVGDPGIDAPNPNPPLPPAHGYELIFVLPSAPQSLSVQQQSYFWFDDYGPYNGHITVMGGSDDIHSPGYPDLTPTIKGNTYTYYFTDGVTFTDNFPRYVEYTWGTDIYVDGVFGDDAVGQPFSITLATVPEPATWTLFIFGFGAIGFLLRRTSVSRLNGSASGSRS